LLDARLVALAQANQVFTVNYTDGTTKTFTQSISDWSSNSTAAGESVALKMAYRDTSTGGTQGTSWKLYGYSFALDPTKTIESITLPNKANVKLFAIDVVA
jgi:hypothetical protein